jgi:RNA polymerase sigma-32 factor
MPLKSKTKPPVRNRKPKKAAAPPGRRKSASPRKKSSGTKRKAGAEAPAVFTPADILPAPELGPDLEPGLDPGDADLDLELDLDKDLALEPEASPGPELGPEEGAALAMRTRAGPLARISPLQRYLAEVRKHPLLSREEEQALAEAFYNQGDAEAGRRLVSSNLRLVVKIALEYYRHWMDLLDLIQEGNLGLVQAVKKFDPYRGIRLSTYSSFWIRAYILKFLMDNWRLVKIGTTQAQRKLFFNLKKEKERLEQLGFKPGARMLAQTLEVKESEVVEMEQRLLGQDESLDAPLGEDEKQTREAMFAHQGPEPETMLADDEFARLVKTKLHEFRDRLAKEGRDKEALIFDHRLLAETPLTLQEMGEKFGVSRERVRQLEGRLLGDLKDFLKQEMPDFEDYDFIPS